MKYCPCHSHCTGSNDNDEKTSACFNFPSRWIGGYWSSIRLSCLRLGACSPGLFRLALHLLSFNILRTPYMVLDIKLQLTLYNPGRGTYLRKWLRFSEKRCRCSEAGRLYSDHITRRFGCPCSYNHEYHHQQGEGFHSSITAERLK